MLDILTKRQRFFLEIFSKEKMLVKNFYLTGGTALTAFYIPYRYSEDLDFFSEKEFEISAIDVFMAGARKKLGVRKIDFEQSYNRNLFFLHFGDEVLKTEFTFFPFPRIEPGKRESGVQVDSILDIAVNKLFTIYQRSRARDYLDLYYICEKNEFTMKDLIAKAKIKFDWHIDPLQLGTQFVKAEAAEDLPRLIENIPQKKWRGFFLDEAKKLKDEILE